MSNGVFHSYYIPGVGEYDGYSINSFGLCSGVFGVQEGAAEAGSPIVLTYVPQSDFQELNSATPPTQQQLNDNAYWIWALIPGPAPYESSYYITSMLPSSIEIQFRGHQLLWPEPPFVIDIQGGNAESGTPLVLSRMVGGSFLWWPYPQTEYSTSQLWNVVLVVELENPFFPPVMLQSVLDPNFAIDLTDYNTAAGTPLQLYPMKPTGTLELDHDALNQMWFIWRAAQDPYSTDPAGWQQG